MPLLMFIAMLFCFGGDVMGQQEASPTSAVVEHSADVIKVLWAISGTLASFAVFVSCGTTIWMLKKVIQHDKDIDIIKERCKFEHEEDRKG